MTDTDFDFPNETAEEAANAAPEAEATEEAPKRRGRPAGKAKHPIPVGWATPSDFVIYVNYHNSLGDNFPEIQAGAVYALREKEGFPGVSHTDDRFIVPIEDSIEWFKSRREEMISKEKEKAQKALERQGAQVRTITKATAAFAKVAVGLH